jgi:DUF4097 and DUF4098 domain-containing protein YvlB
MDFGPRFWVSAEETLTLDLGDTQTLAISTHNGSITTTASDSNSETIVVHVKKRAGAATIGEAEACLDAIELIAERSGTKQELGWKWSTPKRWRWQARVSFDVTSPSALGVDLSTHNGSVKVIGMEGACHATTHNGGVKVDAPASDVTVRAHNGSIDLTVDCERVFAWAHNGQVVARLNGAHNVTGQIGTHNGGVTISMNKSGAANFDCRTHNGSIRSSLNFDESSLSRRSMRGRYGDASGTLAVNTHNGSITIK